MKRTLLAASVAIVASNAFAEPNITIATSTNSRDFPLSADTPLVVPLNKSEYTFTINGVEGNCVAEANQKVKFNRPLSLNCGSPTELKFKVRFNGDYAFTYDQTNQTIALKRQPKKSTNTEFKRPLPKVECEVYSGGEVTIAVGHAFADGEQVRDAYSGQQAKVENGKVVLTPAPNSGGIVLLESVAKPVEQKAEEWRNANIYFVMVDRFNNADTSNDNSYGRHKDGKDEVGTFHGGDLKGVIEKLDYIQSLGTTAIWLSPIVEQVHGFVGGGDKGSFPFYGYHGYWTRDFTKIDNNFGNDQDLKTLVEEAHKRGIKVLLDAVVNHSGYSTLADLQHDGIDVVSPASNWPKQWQDWKPNSGENWHSYHQQVDYNHQNWSQWWGPDWVRAGLPGYQAPGSSDITKALAGLPDFITESDKFVTPPKWLLDNPGTRVTHKENFTVSDYLIEWQSDWVKRFGIDGFRVDTVKHVEGDVWKRLKQEATQALAQWKKDNNAGDEPFWMMGEVWGHNAYRSPYFDDGFDALINFDMQKKMDKGAACFSQMEATYADYANTIQTEKDFNPVSYISSHDTELFFGRFKDMDMQRSAANALLLSPGAVQVYYGDEVARKPGPYADDFHQSTRSDMEWKLNQEQSALLQHWQTLGQFRSAHPAVGAGVHQQIDQDNGYAFMRSLGDDKVVIYFAGKAAK
ncbi:alpha-amylase [Vibrio sp. SCSIO 43136]|uniref:alpha-amylase n=1 Tax=Vibrio sp. SCSIO 43136 TaxID=2819101 RepID=UPI0020762DCE|nr:alpha-amylase [Vibrio sp. SCSIO 43136]USD66816.1 alpha-amylase [Vibrio sp. SCSIO 43136]